MENCWELCGKMSRIGKKPVQIVEGVRVELKRDKLHVSGPKGTLEVEVPEGIKVKVSESQIIVERENDNRKYRALHGLLRQLIYNAVKGVTEGFKKELEVIGTGYRVEVSGDELILRVGHSQPQVIKVPNDLKVTVDQMKTGERNFRIMVEGIDKQKVGQFVANIRAVRPPDVYVDKGIKYVDEVIIKKPGKAAAKTGG